MFYRNDVVLQNFVNPDEDFIVSNAVMQDVDRAGKIKSVFKVCIQTLAVWLAALIFSSIITAPVYFYLSSSQNAQQAAEIDVAFSRRPESVEPLEKWYQSQRAILNVKIHDTPKTLKVLYLTGEKTENPIVPEWEKLGYERAQVTDFQQSPYLFGDGKTYALFYLMTQIGLLLGAIGGWRWLLGNRRFRDFYRGRFGIVQNILIGVFGGVVQFAVMYLCLTLAAAVFGETALGGHPLELASVLSAPQKVLMFLAMVVTAPLVEEFLMRGVILGKFVSAGFPFVGVLFSSVIFAASHQVPVQIISHTVGGAILALIYLWTRSLLANTVAHATVNASFFLDF